MRRPAAFLQRSKWPALSGCLLLAALLFLAGCNPFAMPPAPTLIPPANAPPGGVESVENPPPTAPADNPSLLTRQPILTEEPPVPSVTPTRPPTPVGRGVAPRQAEQQQPLSSIPDDLEPVDWRPPSMRVPLSLHPDDHYWLSRPIPSGRRNYDLEWYPYGNDVLAVGMGPYRIHHGVDFPNETGTPILAAGSGTVIHAGPLPSSRDGVNYYGNTVIIRHDWQWLGQDVYTLYAHTLELFVETGDYVHQGQLIAGVGASGEVSGPHLHLEVRVGRNHYDHTRNPMLWLAPYEGWGVLAGRFIDNRGRMIRGALVQVTPLNVSATQRAVRTYMSQSVNSDEIWRENFVVADLPAGRYTVAISANNRVYRRVMEIQPGRTNFMVVQADFTYIPTAVPPPTPTPEDD